MKRGLEYKKNYIFDFITSDSTGAAADADSTPVVRVFEGDNNTPIYEPGPSSRGFAGHYYVDIETSPGNGFQEGGVYNVVVEATVGGIVGRTVLATFQIGPQVMRSEVVADGGNSTTSFEVFGGLGLPDDAFKDMLLLFTSGDNESQVKKITGSNGTTGFVTVSGPFLAIPDAGDTFILINS